MLKRILSKLNPFHDLEKSYTTEKRNELILNETYEIANLSSESTYIEAEKWISETEHIGENDNCPEDGQPREEPVPEIPQDVLNAIEQARSDEADGPVFKLNNEEKIDEYSKVVAQLNDKWRVIVCKDGIQWILQFRKGSYKGKPAWRGRSYCRSKRGIINVSYLRAGNISQEAQDQLERLPDWVES